MTQQSIAVQPRETAVTASLRRLAIARGWTVTHTTDGVHATYSLHYVGRAVDLADPAGPGVDTPQLLRINRDIVSFVPHRYISELIYAGPGAVCMKNGVRVNGDGVYGLTTMDEHHNHVHLGVTADFTYSTSQPGGSPSMPDDPNIPNIPDIKFFFPVVNTTTGESTGYYIVASDGELHAFGPGAKFFGRSEVIV